MGKYCKSYLITTLCKLLTVEGVNLDKYHISEQEQFKCQGVGTGEVTQPRRDEEEI